MRKLLSILSIGVVLLLDGCGSLAKTTITITEIRDSAMRELAIYHRSGMISPEADKQIAEADEAYRSAARIAADAMRVYQATGDGNPEVVLGSVKTALTSLLDILATYRSVQTLRNDLEKAKRL